MKLCSWNVNGLRAVLKKGALQEFIEKERPDVLCLQEIKARPEQVEYKFSGYQVFWNPAQRPGYSGTAILVSNSLVDILKNIPSRGASPTPVVTGSARSFVADAPASRAAEPPNPLEEIFFKNKNIYSSSVANGLENPCSCPFIDIAVTEGRVLVLDFEKFYLVNVYTPNSKPDLVRLKFRETEWDPGFLNLLKELEKEKPVITCGDFNAAHEEIDIARPQTNHHAAGFTDEERRGITNLVKAGLVDTFRFLHPKEVRYTWWSHWGHARENNVGWRIDYFFISEKLKTNLKAAEIYENYMGSDHCPVAIEMEF